MRSLPELLTDDPAWPWVQGLVDTGGAVVRPQGRAAGEHALHALQVTDRSPMGSLALTCASPDDVYTVEDLEEQVELHNRALAEKLGLDAVSAQASAPNRLDHRGD